MTLKVRMAYILGLNPGAIGTVVGYAFSSDLTSNGPVLPGADMKDVVECTEQPQIPLVLVQFDKQFYNGESCSAALPRVVPIFSQTCTIEMNGESYVREQMPLVLSKANTVHQAQGTNAEWHVMSPPGGPFSDFARGLFYVGLSRGTTLNGLVLLNHRIDSKMFTKWKPHLEEIENEYVRLRGLPKWREVNGI